jgi:hypothetical protein
MNMADHFEIPVIALVDTAGAYPGHRRGRSAAKPKPSRALDGSLPAHRRAQRRRHHRRGRLGRSDRGCNRQPRDHAGALRLQRDLPRRRRFDPVARYHQSTGSRLEHEDHRAGSRTLRRRRHGGAGTDRRRPSRSHCRSDRRDRRRDRRSVVRASGGLDPATIVRLRREKFMAIGTDARLIRIGETKAPPRFSSTTIAPVIGPGRADCAAADAAQPAASGRSAAKVLVFPVKFTDNLYHSLRRRMVHLE